jgi:hypothetical protein
MAASVRGGPGLKARGAGHQCQDDAGERHQLADGEVTGASDDPSVDRKGKGKGKGKGNGKGKGRPFNGSCGR